MVPAHMLFMHLNPSVGRDAEMIISRMRNPLMKLVDLTLVLSVFYHGAYGLFSICQDYLPAGRIRIACGALIMAVMAWLSWVGIRLSLKRGIAFVNHCLAVELLLRDRQCVGCIVFKQKTGEFVRVLAKATVITSGGCGQVFKVTTNCRQNTGDGLALALEAGLPLLDPEAVQFHPTGIVGAGILASETLRSVGGVLRNRDLEPFMVRYAPKMRELAPRDLVARAIESEIREGRGIRNPDHDTDHVWIDLRHLPDEVHERQIPEVSSFFKRYVNLDPQKDLCPVRPSNHYHMGGIATNEFGEVEDTARQPITGLYAVGECAAASFHGFNRLGTNSILELITMGKIAAERVMDHIRREPAAFTDAAPNRFMERFSRYLEGARKDSLGRIRDAMRNLMTEKLSVFRTESGILSSAFTATRGCTAATPRAPAPSSARRKSMWRILLPWPRRAV